MIAAYARLIPLLAPGAARLAAVGVEDRADHRPGRVAQEGDPRVRAAGDAEEVGGDGQQGKRPAALEVEDGPGPGRFRPELAVAEGDAQVGTRRKDAVAGDRHGDRIAA